MDKNVTGGNPVNALDRVWAGLSSTDRVVLLGHDRDQLTSTEKLRLAKTAAALRKRASQRGTQSSAQRGARNPEKTRQPA